MTDNVRVLRCTNSTASRLRLVLEPWAEAYWIEPASSVDVLGRGGAAAAGFVVEHSVEGMVVHGWPGSVLVVQRNGIEMVPGALV
jgi:hypothetical protein